MQSFSKDIAILNGIPAVPTILDVVCRTTGMGFAAVARVTDDRWVACSVLDKIHFGLAVGGELEVETTICHEIRQMRRAVVIDHVSEDELYRDHATPRRYGFQSYISVPIFLPGGGFFGTLCAIDPNPAKVNTPEVIGMFTLFAELIAFHYDTAGKLARSESQLLDERHTAVLREQFIGVLGHDLRTPLGAIAMGAALLRDGGLDGEQTETLDRMERSIARMSGLIDDTLDFTRGRLGGGIALEARSSTSLEPVLTQVTEELRALWPGRGIGVSFALTENVPTDQKRIAQLFTNLLSNALIHGRPDEPVTVSARSGDGRFELSVANAAEPIPPEVRSRLFEPFSRGGSTDYRQGLGLGLYIASEIAKSHGGTLAVSSSVKETRFTFSMAAGG